MPDFAQWSVVANLAEFALAATAVWAAGTRISSYDRSARDRGRFGRLVVYSGGLIMLFTLR